MRSSPIGRTPVKWQTGVLLVVLAALILAPWWRNHRFQRDLYDYGLVMAGTGRIAGGEHPYVDFVTPIQSGIFIFNGWFERLGGGTYQAMTWGAAAGTLLSLVVLAGIFLRRWPAWVALAMAAALGGMTMAQHTIIWHNSLGAVCIAVAACSAAAAPVLRRAQWPWHLLTAVALLAGGITKLNSHLIAVCGVFAWALFAGFSRRAEWPRVGLTALFILGCGFALPIGFELAWAHASPAEWWYNVVALPFGSRSGDLAAALRWKFYFSTRHDYYGPLPVPQLGALGCLVTLGFVVEGIRTLGWRQAGWIIAAAIFAASSGVGLLATNYDIAYVALGAWFALIASLWLGFGLRSTGAPFYGGLVAPWLLLGAIAWHSAWQGQRSQFGYSAAARSEYVAGEKIGPDFSYLRGTLLPPEITASMAATAQWRQSLPAEARPAVFYGPGLEWLERPWPALKTRGIPLWMHGGTSYGANEEARLLAALSGPGPYRHVLVSEARNFWGPVLTPELTGKYTRHRLGGIWFRYDKLPPGMVSWRPVEFLGAFGGNVNSTQLNSTMALQPLSGGRTFVGVTRGTGTMDLTTPSNRAQGEAVLRRVSGTTPGPAATVRFEVFSQAGGNYYPRWSADVKLPEDETERIVPFPVDCGGSPLRFVVRIPPELEDKVAAGWRALNVLHSVDGPEFPTLLRIGSADVETAGDAMRRALLPPDWNPKAVYVRDGRIGSQGFELAPGGELWIRLSGLLTEILGTASVAEGSPMRVDPVVRMFFSKGPKLDLVQQSAIRSENRRLDLKAWSAEPEGWLVVMVDADPGAPPVAIRFTSVKSAD